MKILYEFIDLYVVRSIPLLAIIAVAWLMFSPKAEHCGNLECELTEKYGLECSCAGEDITGKCTYFECEEDPYTEKEIKNSKVVAEILEEVHETPSRWYCWCQEFEGAAGGWVNDRY